ncbi:MAG: penicillin-binding protein 1A [Desulfobacterales bacterium]
MKIRKKRTSQILKKRAKKQNKSVQRRLFGWVLAGIFIAVITGAAVLFGLFFFLSRDLPKISTLADYRPPIITTVYSDDGRKIGEFYRERRIVVPLEGIPEMLKQAFVAAEDARFYHHQGVDIISIIRAFIKNLEAGAIVQGGSTITQQVTKSFFLTPERSYTRKIKEAILAYRIDQGFSKDEILFLYLNQIYLGHGAYGVEAAAQNYFGKSVKALSLAECALLAGLPQAPSKYSPFRNPEMAKQRQIYVLNRMVAEGYITNIQATEAINEETDIKPRRNWFIESVPYFTEYVRQYIQKKYGSYSLYNDGLKVYTTVNIEMQQAAKRQVQKGLARLDKRRGYRRPLQHLEMAEIETYSENLKETVNDSTVEKGQIVEGVIIDIDDEENFAVVRMAEMRGILKLSDMNWARKPDPEKATYEDPVRQIGHVLTVGDVVNVRLKEKNPDNGTWELSLEQTPEVQAALLCIEAETGHVKTMVGGRDYNESQFNRAIQSRRQPGSAFKPIIYAAALDRGYTPATMLIDSPIVYHNEAEDSKWKPKNYEETFHGPTLLRKAFAESVNVVTIKLLQDIGIDYVIDYARLLGISSEIERDLSIALGSSGISLLEMVQAYSVFANQGYRIEPAFVTKVVDRDGNVLEENMPKKERVIESSTAYIMTSLMESVVNHGTGRRVRALNRPVAGKTGTTNNLYDAWFVGYTPRYITGTWVGFDEEKPLGKHETGARAASPIWLGFMQTVLKDLPVRVFQVPDGVVFSKIDAETGLLPIPESESTLFECFKEGTVPTEYTPKPDTISAPDDFFKSGL